MPESKRNDAPAAPDEGKRNDARPAVPDAAAAPQEDEAGKRFTRGRSASAPGGRRKASGRTNAEKASDAMSAEKASDATNAEKASDAMSADKASDATSAEAASDGMNTDLLDRLEQQVAANGRLASRIEALERELKVGKTTIGELSTELEEQREAVHKLQQRLTTARRTMRRHRETEAELERTRNMLMTLQAEVDYAMAQVAAAEQATSFGRRPLWRRALGREPRG